MQKRDPPLLPSCMKMVTQKSLVGFQTFQRQENWPLEAISVVSPILLQHRVGVIRRSARISSPQVPVFLQMPNCTPNHRRKKKQEHSELSRAWWNRKDSSRRTREVKKVIHASSESVSPGGEKDREGKVSSLTWRNLMKLAYQAVSAQIEVVDSELEEGFEILMN